MRRVRRVFASWGSRCEFYRSTRRVRCVFMMYVSYRPFASLYIPRVSCAASRFSSSIDRLLRMLLVGCFGGEHDARVSLNGFIFRFVREFAAAAMNRASPRFKCLIHENHHRLRRAQQSILHMKLTAIRVRTSNYQPLLSHSHARTQTTSSAVYKYHREHITSTAQSNSSS